MENDKCSECMEGAPYKYCCKWECGEHEFCNGCTSAARDYDKRCDREGKK